MWELVDNDGLNVNKGSSTKTMNRFWIVIYKYIEDSARFSFPYWYLTREQWPTGFVMSFYSESF